MTREQIRRDMAQMSNERVLDELLSAQATLSSNIFGSSYVDAQKVQEIAREEILRRMAR